MKSIRREGCTVVLFFIFRLADWEESQKFTWKKELKFLISRAFRNLSWPFNFLKRKRRRKSSIEPAAVWQLPIGRFGIVFGLNSFI